MKKIVIYISLILSFMNMAIAAPVIRFATEATYPPFEYIDSSGTIQGFDIAIAKALCQQMQAECTFSSQSFSSLIPSLKLGKFDALIAAIGVTPERAQQVAFTNSYYEPSASFVGPTAAHYRLADINGKTIGVQQGATMEKYLIDNYKGKITKKAYASIQEAFLDLIAGRVDMVIADTPIATSWLKNSDKDDNYSLVEKPIVDHTYFGTGYGIAVNKNNPALLKALNQALAEIKANGTYDKIVKQYFGE